MTRFLFYVPDANRPSGGVNVIFGLVKTLRANGMDAFVVSSNPTFRYDFLSKDLQIFYAPQIREPKPLAERMLVWRDLLLSKTRNTNVELRRDDIIVVPEYVSSWLPRSFPDNACVLLNQNFYALAVAMLSKTWDARRFAATLSISQTCHALARVMNLEHAREIPLAVDQDTASGAGAKKNIIAYMPRRRPLDVQIVTKLLKDRGHVKDFELRPLDNLTRNEVAQELREASIFLSFSELEGFGLPPAEAMLAGCLVVGFTGVAGAEFLDREVGFPIEDGNVMEFVTTVEAVAERCRKSDPATDQMRQKASARIAQNYGQEKHDSAVTKVFGEFASMLPVR